MMGRVHVAAMASLLAVAGCGGSASSGSGGTSGACSGTKVGTLLTDEQLCKLTCNSTTRQQAIDVLGAPDSSFEMTSITYNYVCGTAAGVDGLLVELEFDATTGALIDVSRAGHGSYSSGALPSCISGCKRH